VRSPRRRAQEGPAFASDASRSACEKETIKSLDVDVVSVLFQPAAVDVLAYPFSVRKMYFRAVTPLNHR
jgi:hypothetical protein